MIYGYVSVRRKVTNREEFIQRQSELLQELGVEKIIVETDGSQLQDMLDNLKSGDAVHVVSIDRLTRSVQRMAELAIHFQKNNISLYEADQPINLKMFLLMNELASLPSYYEDEYEEDEDEDEPEKDIPSDHVVDLCFSILECKTSHDARKIIDSFPEERLKHLALFLYHQYYNLKELLE